VFNSLPSLLVAVTFQSIDSAIVCQGQIECRRICQWLRVVGNINESLSTLFLFRTEKSVLGKEVPIRTIDAAETSDGEEGVKWSGREADLRPLSNAKVKNKRSRTSSPPICPLCVQSYKLRHYLLSSFPFFLFGIFCAFHVQNVLIFTRCFIHYFK